MIIPSPHEPRSFRHTEEKRTKPYTLSQLSDKFDAMHMDVAEVVALLAAIKGIAGQTLKFVKWGAPLILGAIVASGKIGGALGSALKYVVDHWPWALT